MDTVTLVVTALSRGAARGAAEAAGVKVADAYRQVKERVAERFAGHPRREMILANHESQPDIWQAPLAAALAESGAATDPELVDSAQRLLALIDEAGTPAAKYKVDLRGAQGVQVGDQNFQTNTFSAPPSDR
jgi:hypothetical protein